MRCKVLLLAFWGAVPVTALADEWRDWAFGERFRLAVGYYSPDITTTVQISEVDGITPNDPVDLENELGLDDSDQTFLAALDWRFARRHELALRYFALDRSASRVLDTEVEIDDTVYPVGAEVDTKLDISVFEVAYAYSVIFTERSDLSLGIGVSAQDFDFAIASRAHGLEDSNFVAPLPTLNINYDYALNDKWYLKTGFGWLDVSFDVDDADIDGSIIRYDVGVEWRALKNVSVGLAYSVFDVEVDYADDEDNASFDYRYKGPVLSLSTYF